MSRRVVAVAILASWLASLGWLGWRTVSPDAGGAPEARAVRLAPVSTFYAVLAGDAQVGTAGITLDTTALGYRLTEVLALDLPGAAPVRHVLRAEAVLSRGLRLQRAEASVSEAGSSFSLEATIRPDSTTLIRSGYRGVNRVLLERLAAMPGATLPGASPFRLVWAGRLRPRGALASAEVDLMSRAARTSLAEVQADSVVVVSDSAVLHPVSGQWEPADPDTVRAWQVFRTERGLPVREWMDGQGRVLRRDHAFGLRYLQSPFEVNYTNYQNRRRTGELGEEAPLSGGIRLVDQRRRPDTMAQEIRAVLQRRDGPAWPGSVARFEGGRQTVAGDTVTIHAEPVGADSSTPTRWRNTPAGSAADSAALRRALDEALEAQASEPDTIRRLVMQVAHGVRYLDTQTEPTGFSTVLRDRRAGLEGKVALMVALARQAGLPARAVTGVDLSDPALPAHMWVEVWQGGWRAVDPVLGHAPASPWLLRVTEGSAARPLALVPLIGNLRATLLTPLPGGGRR